VNTEQDLGDLASDSMSAALWPVGTSQSYIDSRRELARAEQALHGQVGEVAAARRRLPPGAVLADYVFAEGPADPGAAAPVRTTRLTELFGEHGTLFIYHLMFSPDAEEACPMCSMWVDGLHGVSHHLAQHTAFAVIGKAPLPRLRSWAGRRGWDGVRVLSSYGTSFNLDMRAEDADGNQRPMVSVLVRDGDQVRHSYSLAAGFLDGAEGGIDLLSPVWHVLDLLPGGRGDWYAENSYAGRARG
jgi:predicted dithiol-disulfide oxidoreductase (DUF899 family)